MHGAFQGTWYYEVRMEHLGATGHARLGWGTRKAELQAPVRLIRWNTLDGGHLGARGSLLAVQEVSLQQLVLLVLTAWHRHTAFIRPNSGGAHTSACKKHTGNGLPVPCVLRKVDVDLPPHAQVGYNEHSYAYRDLEGSKVHRGSAGALRAGVLGRRRRRLPPAPASRRTGLWKSKAGYMAILMLSCGPRATLQIEHRPQPSMLIAGGLHAAPQWLCTLRLTAHSTMCTCASSVSKLAASVMQDVVTYRAQALRPGLRRDGRGCQARAAARLARGVHRERHAAGRRLQVVLHLGALMHCHMSVSHRARFM